jgi:hypothetical protein
MHLLQAIKTGLTKIQYQPGLIERCLAGTGLSLEPDEPTSRALRYSDESLR